jgi:hypothetical protein
VQYWCYYRIAPLETILVIRYQYFNPDNFIPIPECSKSADIAFIMDGSSAADESTWNRLKSFARGVANAFLLHDDATRVGLITYSTQPKLELQFDEKNDRDEFSDFLNTVTPTHGTPNLEQALAMANDKLFVPSAGMRTKVSGQKLHIIYKTLQHLCWKALSILNCSSYRSSKCHFLLVQCCYRRKHPN